MTSLSNLIKVSQYVPVEVLKQLNLGKNYAQEVETDIVSEDSQPIENEVSEADLRAEEARKQMLTDAKEFAERQVRDAADEADRMLAEAKQQIEAWWQEQRQQDEDLVEAIKAEGFNQGYEEGKAHAEEMLQQQINEMMDEASRVLKLAYSEKETIIQEAEPFVVELSCAIAEKVIDKELSNDPEHMLFLIKQNLARKKEQGIITLCVAPSHFAFVQAAREELELSLDSQAELQILPDPTVIDRGCVIRSSFGSIDARIDTQLKEIKKELQRISMQVEEQRQDET